MATADDAKRRRLNIYVRPEDNYLVTSLEAAGVNLSRLFALAARTEASKSFEASTPEHLRPAAERLREQFSAARDHAVGEGFDAGVAWVTHDASFEQLRRLERGAPEGDAVRDEAYYEQLRTAGLLDLIQDASTWTDDVGRPLRYAWVRGWVDGALRSWAAIKKEVLSF